MTPVAPSMIMPSGACVRRNVGAANVERDRLRSRAAERIGHTDYDRLRPALIGGGSPADAAKLRIDGNADRCFVEAPEERIVVGIDSDRIVADRAADRGGSWRCGGNPRRRIYRLRDDFDLEALRG